MRGYTRKEKVKITIGQGLHASLSGGLSCSHWHFYPHDKKGRPPTDPDSGFRRRVHQTGIFPDGFVGAGKWLRGRPN
jgi:hypothetical protein